MRNISTRYIIIVIMLLLDWYVFTIVRHLAHHLSDRARIIIYSIYWFISVFTLCFVLFLPFIMQLQAVKYARLYAFTIVIGIFFAKLFASVFFLIDDIRRGGFWLTTKIFPGTGVHYIKENNGIPRSTFLSWLGIAIGGSLFATLLYGFTNKYNYKIRTIKLSFKNLPQSFKGLKIVQVSDIHSGSFQNKEAVNHGVDMVLQQKPDLILFTGDLVNDRAVEMHDYMDVFSRLKAPMGVYSTLGNHDYGDYYDWPDDDDAHKEVERRTGKHIFTPLQKANIERLKQIHGELGWRLLMNEHVPLTKNNEQIALIGIENWSAKRNFPKYGRMDLAYPGAEKYPFKILMSHDPSHWDAEVRPKYPDIDLTLAGHTHGMQFGVEIPGFRFSPVQWVYNQWAGLYKQGKQMIYVNRGYGFIGYPGRVGILPEVTVIELV